MHGQGHQPQRVHRLDRLRHLSLLLLLVAGCEEKVADPGPAQTGRRTAAVKPAERPLDPSGFCEKTFPAEGPEARKFAWPPLREVKGQQPATGDGWTWVNVWATWCKPCLEEMPLIGRWKEAMDKERTGVKLELLSIDTPDAEAALAQRVAAGLPGPTRWLREEGDFGPFLDGLGVDRSAAIPIHAFVDPAGMLRCVRVGAIHGRDFGAVKNLVTAR